MTPDESQQRVRVRVIRWSGRGYGFCRTPDGTDGFLHVSQILDRPDEAVMLRDITARQKRIIATLEASIASLETIAGLTNVAQLQNMEKY